MKHALFLSVAALAIVQTSQAAVIQADRVVITRTSNLDAVPAFHIAEVMVFEQGTATNIAAGFAGATATASSTGWGTSPSWAIDGNTDGNFGGNSTWHDTDGEAGDDPNQIDFLSVTFSGPKNVDSFQVWGRIDCCPLRDDGFNVDFFLGGNLVLSQPSGITVGFDTGMTSINAVPEPGWFGLFAGALVFGARRRRKA